jgi:hypothetical protein
MDSETTREQLLEQQTIRTYTTGLSVKHFPREERRAIRKWIAEFSERMGSTSQGFVSDFLTLPLTWPSKRNCGEG